MRRKSWAILVLIILVASTLVGCGSSSTLTILSITEGDVSVMRAGTNSWTEAQVGMSLEAGDSIKTDGDSSAEITFFEGSTIELQANTEIEIASLDISAGTGSTTINLEQVIGTTISRVTKILDPASRYEVATPTGVVAVRGSVMQVYVIEDGTTLATNLEGDIRAIAQSVELQIPEGQQCIISPGQPPKLVVTFADPNLEAAIREAIGKPAGHIYESDLLGLTSFNATQRDIMNLSGIEYCTNLTSLGLWENQISDITPLANLTNLTWLYLGANPIGDISSLANLANLTTLGLWDNQISDISPLANLTNLTWLNVGANQISDTSPLAGLTGLTTLWLHNNPLTNISPLADLINLTGLDLELTQISDIAPLAKLTNLTWLFFWGSPIGDIAPLADLANLTYLKLQNNEIGDIAPLTNLTNLAWLDLDGNQISDITPLADLTNLTWLSLAGNQIGDIASLANLTSLTWLHLATNQISDISPLANLSSLTELSLPSNQVSDITPLVGLSNLTWLSLWDNHVGDVSVVTDLTNLTGLELSENQISDISPLVENEGLSEGDYVDLRWNPLSEHSINTYIPQLDERGVTFNPEFPLSDTETCSLDTAWVENPGTGNYYALTTYMSWMAAEACAQAWGGHLVTLNNREEESWVKDVFGRDEGFWIGFYVFGREHRAENFIWSSGEPVTYTNWGPGQPDNSCGEETVVNLGGDYWNDCPRDEYRRGVVEVSEKPD